MHPFRCKYLLNLRIMFPANEDGGSFLVVFGLTLSPVRLYLIFGTDKSRWLRGSFGLSRVGAIGRPFSSNNGKSDGRDCLAPSRFVWADARTANSSDTSERLVCKHCGCVTTRFFHSASGSTDERRSVGSHSDSWSELLADGSSLSFSRAIATSKSLKLWTISFSSCCT